MTTLEEIDAAPDVTHQAATAVAEGATAAAEATAAADDDGDLDPELNTDFQVDPAYASSKQLEVEEEQTEAARKVNKDGIQSLKSAFIIAGVAVAVVGAICAVAKNVKEARH